VGSTDQLPRPNPISQQRSQEPKIPDQRSGLLLAFFKESRAPAEKLFQPESSLYLRFFSTLVGEEGRPATKKAGWIQGVAPAKKKGGRGFKCLFSIDLKAS
jgi:hypothetical protein